MLAGYRAASVVGVASASCTGRWGRGRSSPWASPESTPQEVRADVAVYAGGLGDPDDHAVSVASVGRVSRERFFDENVEVNCTNSEGGVWFCPTPDAESRSRWRIGCCPDHFGPVLSS